MPASRKGVHYAFLSAPVETRWTASRGAPPPLFGPGLSLGGKPNAESTSSQQTDIRPGTDWTFLMSAPAFRGQKQPPKTPPKLVQRPWPEYIPESSAPIGRSWSNHSLSNLHETGRCTRSDENHGENRSSVFLVLSKQGCFRADAMPMRSSARYPVLCTRRGGAMGEQEGIRLC